MQQIDFTRSTGKETLIFFITEEVKETVLDFFSRNAQSILISLCFNIILII